MNDSQTSETHSGRELTDRQKRFVEQYIGTPLPNGGCPPGFSNATKAATAAGYAWPGKQGPRLLSFPLVAEAIEARSKEIWRQFEKNQRQLRREWRANLHVGKR